MPRDTPTAPAIAREAAGLQQEMDRLGREVDRITREAWRLEPGGAQGLRGPHLTFGRIVLAIDGTPASVRAAHWASRIAQAFGSKVWVVTVIPPAMMLDYYASAFAPALTLGGSALFREEEAAAARLVSDAAGRLRDVGIEAEGVPVSGAPAPEIVRLAEREHADLVIMGAHDDAIARAMLGSVAEGVKNHTAASILLARNDPPPRRILVPVDGSRGSKRAAGLALRLSKAWDAPASFLHVVEPLAAVPEVALRDAVAKSLSGIDLQWTQPRATAAVEVGKPGDAILRAAERERAGLVVMGSRGLTGLRSIVAGSVSNRVAHAARTSVLLVKEPSD